MVKDESYDVSNPFDRLMVLDQPYSVLNKRGRRAKKRSKKGRK